MGSGFIMIIVTLFLIGMIMLLYMSFEATNLKVTHLKYQTGGQVICLADQTNYLSPCLVGKDSTETNDAFNNADNSSSIDVTASVTTLKILNISDIHIKFLRVSLEKIARQIRENNPDIVLLSGDYIDNTGDEPLFIEFLRRSGITDKPCYGVFGNHDYKAVKYDEDNLKRFIKLMKTNGLHILSDESIMFNKNGVIYNIIGLRDLRDMKPDYAKAYSNLDTTAKMNIVIAHNPDTVLNLPEDKTDLVLAGHFHGGQIWLPFKLEYKVFRREELCMRNISRGMHHVNGIDIYINRGLGNVVVPMRFQSRPEILFIEV